ncbi:hypothetical protein FB451DRAFT_1241662 [Mycena latifolia]|nr:hypothetical protein FB451DRAFT_1241662 [Mycena latifolia]
MPLDLDADVLFRIFASVDVYTVLSLSRVNKSFRAIASTKQLWLSIVHDLAWRSLINPPADDWESLSTTELQEEVRRAVVGPRTWSAPSAMPPTLSRQIVVPFEGLQGLDNARLPGTDDWLACGRYLSYRVFRSSNIGRNYIGVHCWDVRAKQRVWAWEQPGYTVKSMTFDVLGGGLQAIVSLVCDVHELHATQLSILEVDFKTGGSCPALELPATPGLRLGRPKISGEIVACRMSASSFLLGNWRTAEFIIFDAKNTEENEQPPCNPTIVLCPGHMILASPRTGLAPDHLRLYSISSFCALWRPSSDFDLNSRIDMTGIPYVPLNLSTNTLPTQPSYHGIKIYIRESQIHDETYHLIVRLVDVLPPEIAPKPPTSPITSLLKRIRHRLRHPFTTPVHMQPPDRTRIKTVFRYHLILPNESPPSLALPHLTLKSVVRDPKCSPSGTGWGISSPRSSPTQVFVHPLPYAGMNPPPVLAIQDQDMAYKVQASRTGAVMVSYHSRAVVYYSL